MFADLARIEFDSYLACINRL